MRYEYIGKAGKHFVNDPNPDPKKLPSRRALQPGEVIELTEEQAESFSDRFRPAAEPKKKKKREGESEEPEGDKE